MTLPLAFEHFDDLVATPDDVEQLHRVILQLAVQGKLGTQDQNDEPVSALLAAIHLQKPQKPSKKKVKDAEKVICIPENWVACPITELFDLLSIRGKQLQTKEYLDKGRYPIVSQGKELIVGYSDQDDLVVHLDKPVIIFGDHTREVKYIDFDFIAGADGIKILNPIQPLNEKYFYLVLKSIHFESRGYARHFQKVTEIHFPLPPLAEQQRIVARVEELFAQTRTLAKELAHSQIELDGLNKSALSHLLASETPEEFNQHWDFIAEHFNLLFQSPEHIAPLRQSILELAVRGKLTRREAGDRKIDDYLREIEIEKTKFAEKNEFKKEKPLPSIQDDEIRFDVPENWKWVRLIDICVKITDGFHETPIPTEDGYPYVLATHVKSKGIDFDNCFYVSEIDHKRVFSKATPRKGDVLVVSIGAGSATPAVIDVDFEFSFKNVAILNKASTINTKYLFYYLLAIKQSVFDEITRGGAQPYLSLKMLKNLVFPLAPLGEQERIEKRVEQLLSLCDTLEARLQSAEEERGRLVRAVMGGVAPTLES